MTKEELIALLGEDVDLEAVKALLDSLESKEGYVTQSELDRRVNEVSQKHIKDEKALEKKIRKQIEDEAKLTAEEKAAALTKDAEEKLREVSIRENKLNALEKCVAAGISKEQAETMLTFLVTDNEETTSANVDTFIENYNKTVNSIKESFMGDNPTPQSGGGDNKIDKAAFDKMSMTEQIKLKEENPELVKSFMER
jgi:hypothetical protein